MSAPFHSGGAPFCGREAVLGKASAPKPQDPKETASAQTATNVATAQANAILGNVNQKTPYGTLEYNQTGQRFVADPTAGQTVWVGPDGQYSSSAPQMQTITETTTGRGGGKFAFDPTGQNSAGDRSTTTTRETPPEGWSQQQGYLIPQWEAVQSLSPEQQAILDQSQGAQLNLATLANTQSAFLNDYLGKPIDTSGVTPVFDISKINLPQLQQLGSTDYAGERGRVEQALLDRMRPQLDARRASTENQLVNQGFRRGAEGYDRGMDEVSQAENDAYLGAILAGGQEQSRLADLDLRSTAFNNQTAQTGYQNQLTQAQAQDAQRGRQLQELYTQRNQPINEIIALLSGSQIQNPNWINTNMPTIPTTDYAGLVQQHYRDELAAWENDQAQTQGILGGLFGLGSSILKYSDERLKEGVRRVGWLDNGLPVYLYRYKAGGPPEIGLIAQDVERANPNAVVRDAAGMMMVDYTSAVGS